MMIYLKLFFIFLKIGAFSFGGGYAMLPIIERELVVIQNFLSHSEFIDIVGISQMSPGPIAVNAATFIGFKVNGLLGSISATLGVISFSFFSMCLLAKFINQYKDASFVKGIFLGIRPSIVALIAAACISLFKTSIIDFRSFLIGALILISLYKTKLHPIALIVLSGIAGVIIYSLSTK